MAKESDRSQFNRYAVDDSFIAPDNKFVCSRCCRSEIRVHISPKDIHLECAACGNTQPLTAEDIDARTD